MSKILCELQSVFINLNLLALQPCKNHHRLKVRVCMV